MWKVYNAHVLTVNAQKEEMQFRKVVPITTTVIRALVVCTEFSVDCGMCENKRGKLCQDIKA